MRRALVLTDEAARHPFLASLPAHVRMTDAEAATKPRRPGSMLRDLRDCAAAYSACFIATSLYIA